MKGEAGMGSVRFYVMTAAMVLTAAASGCVNGTPAETPAAEANSEVQHEKGMKIETLVPYQANEQTFQMVGGWLKNDTVVFAEYSRGETILYSYNYTDGQKNELFKADMAITHFETSSKGDYILLQGSSSPKQTDLLLIDSNGKVRFKKQFSSHDLAFSWSKTNSDRLFVTTFNEDWSYKTTIYYPLSGSERISPVDAAFAEWNGDDKLLYMKDGTQSSGSLLYQYDLERGEEKVLSDGILAVFSGGRTWIALEGENGQLVYAAHKGLQKQQFTGSLIPEDAATNVPKVEINPSGNNFLSFEYDDKANQLNLISYSLDQEKKSTLLADVKNAPMVFSPDGTKILYGFQLEKMYNIATGSLKTLIRF